jgi:serine protease Do
LFTAVVGVALRRLSPVLAVLVVAAMGRSTPAGAQEETSGPPRDAALNAVLQLQDAFAAVAERVFPSVVIVTSYVRKEPSAAKSDSQSGQWRESGEKELYPGFHKLYSGSGVVIGEAGQVISLRQFVVTPDGEPADLVDVETQDGRRALSRIVGVEPTLNIAVLEFIALPKRFAPQFEPATIGDSDSMRIGYWAIAAGDPSGPEKTFSPGVLSAQPERRCYQDELSATYMLVSSPKLHPEAYGGPLVNIRGELVGITTPRVLEGAPYSGIEYALPINIILPVYNGISVERSFRSPWLGVSVLEMTALRDRLEDPEEFASMLRPRFGIYIDNVFDPSPAARAGIHVGDFLLRLNGEPLTSAFRFQQQLYLAGIGRVAKLEIFRDGELLHLQARVEERPQAAAPR